MSIIYAYRLEHISNGKGPWNFAIDDKTEIFVGDLPEIQRTWHNAYVAYKDIGGVFELVRYYLDLPVFHWPKMVTGFTSLDKLLNYFFFEKDLETFFSRANFVIRKYQVNGRLRIHEQSQQIAFVKCTASVIEECPV